MTAVEVLGWVVNAIFLLASIAALRLWVRHRSSTTAWLVATFGAFDVIILASELFEESLQEGLPARLLIVLLLGSPYLLYRFADAVVTGPSGARRVADALLVVVVATTLLLPTIPADGMEGMSVTQTAWVVLVLGFWAGLDMLAGWLLGRASVGEPGVVRNRLRVLALAAVGLGLYVPASASLGENPSPATAVVSQAVVVVLGLLFLVGFAPPNLLRAAWRERDERRLYEAAVGLMGAQHPDDVAAVVVPGVRALLGAPNVTMRSASGRVMARTGPEVTARRAVREVQHRTIAGVELEIVVAPTMPIFGSDESQHLDRLALLAELALDRVRLLAAEREARDNVERLNDELESFVYTTSHDLKNPVIALIGYLDVLAEDHAADLPSEVAHILDRMQVNARHMDSLIRDLLELSRVGRVDVMPDRVDLELVVDDLARDLQASRDGLQITRGDLPALWMNPTRVRQLFTNLFDNAAAYGGRPVIAVTVTAEPRADGIRIVVRDDGRGIDAAHLERVFGVFERLEPEATGGTGMGLAICRRIVEHVGGSMRAVASDDGAVFHIDLPSTAVHVGAPSPTRLEAPTP